jgi:hypothetical protein
LPRAFTYLDGRIPVGCHEHVAIVHRGGDAAARGVEFLREGLGRGHWCCCRAPAALHGRVLTHLRQKGVDVQGHRENRTLQFPQEPPAAGDWLDGAKKFFAEAEAAGAPAVRWLEEGIWVQPAGAATPQFFEVHSRLNYLVKQYPSVALCQYDMGQLEVPQLFSAIAVHRHLLIENTLVRDNPFYIPAEKFVAMNPEDRERDLRDIYREVGFDLEKLLTTLAGYGQLQRPTPPGL